MIRFRGRRIPPAALAGPLLALLALGHAQGQVAFIDPAYRLAGWAAGASTLFLLAPACAALSAWEAGLLRAGGLWALPSVRHRAVVMMRVAWLPWLVGLVVLFGVATAVAGGPPSGPGIPVVAVVVMSAFTLAGATLGLLAPRAVAVPVALAAGYLWMVVPPALTPLWLRHLTGVYDDCCAVDETLALAPVVGSVLVAAGLAIASLLVATTRRRARFPGAAAVLALGVASGAWVVHGLGASEVTDRAGRLMCAKSADVQVCAWPEHADAAPQALPVAARTVRAWRAAGLTVPNRFTEQRHPGPRTGNVSLTSGAAVPPLVRTMASGLLPPVPACADGGDFPGAVAGAPVAGWLASVAGLPLQQAAPGDPFTVQVLQQVRGWPMRDQLAWYERNVAALRSCDRQPSPDLRPGAAPGTRPPPSAEAAQ